MRPYVHRLEDKHSNVPQLVQLIRAAMVDEARNYGTDVADLPALAGVLRLLGVRARQRGPPEAGLDRRSYKQSV